MARTAGIIVVLGVIAAGGCTDAFNLLPIFDSASVKLIIHNDSATKHVSPNPGLCPQGLEVQTHSFLENPPVLAPGASVTITTLDIGGFDGLCADADPSFMVGFCGWKFGEDPNNLSACTEQYGGQIGYQFHCGDTLIMRWTDSGGTNGTWTTEVQPAMGNPAPTMEFQVMEGTGGCQL